MSGEFLGSLGRQIRSTKNRDAAVSSVLSSGTNAAVSLVGAALLSSDAFGMFSLGVMVALLVSTLVNGFAGEVALSEVKAGKLDGTRGPAAAGLWLSLAAGAGVSIVGVISAQNVTNELVTGWSSLTVGFAVAAATLHRVVRDLAFARESPRVAVILDLVWLIGSGALIVGLVSFGVATSAENLLACWAGGAVLGVLWIRRSRPFSVPAPSVANEYLRQHGRFGASLAYNSGVNRATKDVTVLLVGAFVSLAALGGLRLAQSLLGLSTVVFSAARARVLPMLARPEISAMTTRRYLRWVSGVLAAVPLVAMLGVLILEPILSRTVQATTWRQTTAVLLPVTLIFVGSALCQGAMIGLRIAGSARSIVLTRTSQAVVTLLAGVVGVYAAGVTGAAWGLAVGNGLGVLFWWRSYHRVTTSGGV